MPERNDRPHHVLSDPHRRAIIELLEHSAHTASTLTEHLDISRGRVTRHLHELREAGLITDETQGSRQVYSLLAKGAEALREHREKLWDEL